MKSVYPLFGTEVQIFKSMPPGAQKYKSPALAS